jgi:hypothetical protein
MSERLLVALRVLASAARYETPSYEDVMKLQGWVGLKDCSHDVLARAVIQSLGNNIFG